MNKKEPIFKEQKVILLATDSLAEPVLKYLNKKFSLRLVITAPISKIGRNRKTVFRPAIRILAEKLNIKTISPKKFSLQTVKLINQIKPDFILIFAYGKIIPTKKINCQKLLNIHPSLLPKLRGPSPIRYSILQGCSETGVSLMLIDDQIDHGPIISQKKIRLKPDENYLTLREKVKDASLKLIKKDLPKYLQNKLKPKDQDHSQASYTKLIKKSNGLIDLSDPIEKIERKIRAFNPWPGTFIKLDGKILKIHSAKIINNKLKLDQVQLEGRRQMSFEDFKRGYRGKLAFLDKIS